MPKRERSAAGELTKGPWTPLEDEILVEYVQEHGEGDWNRVGPLTGIPRSGKSCRLRWLNHLRPDLKKGSFSDEEERLVVELHARLGNKWSLIATQLPGRTDNDIKNFWKMRVKRHESAGWPLYPPGLLEANPEIGDAPMVPGVSSLPARSLDLPADNVPAPPSLVQPNGNAALAYAQGDVPAFPRVGGSLISSLPPFIHYADQSSEMGFSALHSADLGADRHQPSTAHCLPSFGPVSETTMPEFPSCQHLKTGQDSRPSLPLHQIVDTKQHLNPLAAENGLLQSIGLLQANLHAPQSSKTTNGGLDPRCNEIRTEGQSAWPAFIEQVPDSRELSLGPNSNPEPTASLPSSMTMDRFHMSHGQMLYQDGASSLPEKKPGMD